MTIFYCIVISFVSCIVWVWMNLGYKDPAHWYGRIISLPFLVAGLPFIIGILLVFILTRTIINHSKKINGENK